MTFVIRQKIRMQKMSLTFRVRCTTSKENGAKLLVSFLWPWKYKEAMGRYHSLDSCVCVCVCVLGPHITYMYSFMWQCGVLHDCTL